MIPCVISSVGVPLKFWPDDGARSNVRGSLKSLQSNISLIHSKSSNWMNFLLQRFENAASGHESLWQEVEIFVFQVRPSLPGPEWTHLRHHDPDRSRTHAQVRSGSPSMPGSSHKTSLSVWVVWSHRCCFRYCLLVALSYLSLCQITRVYVFDYGMYSADFTG